MSTYTMTLGELIESNGGNIGLDDYELFNEAHREILNGKIVDQYTTREIGQESVPLFIHRMRRKMNLIMPAYNELYKTTLIDFDPLLTVYMETEGESENEQTSDTKNKSVTATTAESSGSGASYEMPSQQLQDKNERYATAANDSKSDATNSGTSDDESKSTTDGTAKSLSKTKGYQGSAADLIIRARAAIINVDLLIVDELEPLFMFVLGNEDSFTQSAGMYGRGYRY